MAARHVISALLLVAGALALTSLVANYLLWRATVSVRPAEPYQPPSVESAQGLR